MKRKQLIREHFRNSVFDRDGYSCKFCGCTENLDAHHITDRNEMPNGGYVKENGITVCHGCHIECEVFHISGGSNCVDGKHPDDLYELIGSSIELATTMSTKLLE